MTNLNRSFIVDVIAACLLYVMVILYQGYQYGQSDQSQILPVLFAQDHPGAYANDHYVNEYLKSGINERTVFHLIFRQIGYGSPVFVFIWHALASLALIIAWIRIASIIIKNRSLVYLSIGLVLTIGFHTSTGSNEIYYNQFIPSLPAKALASWAIYAWLKESYYRWDILLVLSSFLQPLAGLQVFILTLGASILYGFYHKDFARIPFRCIQLYMIMIIPWFVMLYYNNGGHENPKQFMEIIGFRLSHHFFATSFGWIHLLFLLVFGTFGILLFHERMRWFVILLLAGCVVYEIGVEIFRSPFVLYTQWWKTTIWLEAFAFVAVLSWIEKTFHLEKKLNKLSLLVLAGLTIAVGVYRLSGIFGASPVYMAPLSKYHSDEVDISLQAQELTNDDALFLIPPHLSAFRWYSKRSNYVDYKAMIHTENFLNDWYTRVSQVFQVPIDPKRLDHPDPETIENWKSLGISHIINTAPGLAGFTLLASNDTYFLYELPR